MSATICGHERHALARTLHDVATVPNLLNMATRAFDAAGRDADIAPHSARVLDLHDPAKLAEMLAERGRQLGIDAVVLQCGTVPDPYPSAIVWHHADMLAIEAFLHHSGALTMAQARALLAAWLDLPDGDRVGAENALREINE